MGPLKPGLALRLGAHALAAAVGARMGYGFGVQLGGAPMAFLMGANAAIFAWLMAGALSDAMSGALLRLKRS